MSRENSPSVFDHASDSSGPPSRGSYSDTTPSPSGGIRLPPFNPHALSSKLALLEASESLAQVAETLSIASKAMSKAAASLAAASGYREYEYNADAIRVRERQPACDWIESPDWQRSTYTLPSFDVSRGKKYASDENQSTFHESKGIVTGDIPEGTRSDSACISNDQIDFNLPPNTALSPKPSLERTLPTEINGAADLSPAAQLDKLTEIGPSRETEAEVHGIPSDESVESDEAEDEPGGSEESSESDGSGESDESDESDEPDESDESGGSNDSDSTTNASESEGDTDSESQDTHTLAGTNKSSRAFNHTIRKSMTRIVLDSGFDELPAVCDLLRRQTKTICMWKYWASAMSVGYVIRNISTKATILPASLKPDKLQVAIDEFTSPKFVGVLLWPAHIEFSDFRNSSLHRNVQVIHIGTPLEENAGIETSKVTIVMAQSEWKDIESKTRSSIGSRYGLDPANSSYNHQGAKSELKSGRQWMRSYLGKKTSPRTFYAGWITGQRKYNPEWPANQLVKRANRYAEEYLLHGQPGKGKDLIGGRIPLSSGVISSLKLEPAVKAGLLPVY